MPKDKVYQTKDIMKRQIAFELGYGEIIQTLGWGYLTSAQAGKIGGVLRGKMRKLQQNFCPNQ